MGTYKVNGHWRCRFMIRGVRYFVSLPDCKTKTQARAAEEQYKTEARAGKLGASSKRLSFAEFVTSEYLPYSQTNKLSYRDDVSRSKGLIAAFGKLALDEISTFVVEKFKREEIKRVTKRKKPQTPASVNRSLALLSAILSYAEKQGLIRHESRPEIKLLRQDNIQIKYLTVEQENQLREVLCEEQDLLDLVVVAIGTGMRRRELLSVEASQVDFNRSAITLLRTKSGRPREIPITGEVREILARRSVGSIASAGDARGYIFVNPRTGTRYFDPFRSLNAAYKAAGIPFRGWHVLRHTFGTRLVSSGSSISTVMDLMGHSDLETTRRYVHAVETEKRSAIVRLSEYRQQSVTNLPQRR